MKSPCEQALPQWVLELLTNPPPSGDGFHNWLFRAARALHPYWQESEIRALLSDAAMTAGRPVPAKEIEDAIQNSKTYAWNPHTRNPGGGNAPPKRATTLPRWPARDMEAIAHLADDGFRKVDLWEASPWRLDDGAPDAEEAIDCLFPGNGLLCCGAAQDRFATRPREDWRGQLAGLQFIVPSPMSALTGLSQEGKVSARCLNNTGPRLYLVVECDFPKHDRHVMALLEKHRMTTQDLCATVIAHLADYAPLVIAVNSAGKSLHGWFNCDGQTEETLHRFMCYAVRHGGDPYMWTRCQLTRMPEGIRADNSQRQRIEYFNPPRVTP